MAGDISADVIVVGSGIAGALVSAQLAAEGLKVAILEAAHLIADADGGLPTVENGRLMCPNHHKAFDAHFFHLDAEDDAICQEGIDEF